MLNSDQFLDAVQTEADREKRLRMLSCRMFILDPLRLRSNCDLTFGELSSPMVEEEGLFYVELNRHKTAVYTAGPGIVYLQG